MTPDKQESSQRKQSAQKGAATRRQRAALGMYPKPPGRPRTIEIKTPYKQFAAALMAMGETLPDIARAVGVTPRSITNYLSGDLPAGRTLAAHPTLLAALLRDVHPEVIV